MQALVKRPGRHSPQGECGLKFLPSGLRRGPRTGHSPQGECGLKYGQHQEDSNREPKSLPARGVWIEINNGSENVEDEDGHSPQGECGLKLDERSEHFRRLVVTPCKGSVD